MDELILALLMPPALRQLWTSSARSGGCRTLLKTLYLLSTTSPPTRKRLWSARHFVVVYTAGSW